jgi:hypothetical protein
LDREPDAKHLLAATWLTPQGSSRRPFPTLSRYDVSLLAKLEVAGVAKDLTRSADGSAQAVGSNGVTGWIAHHSSASGGTSVSTETKHEYGALVETNMHGDEYRAMVLARNFIDADNNTQSDIETFRGSPGGGFGWSTEPPTHTDRSDSPIQSKISIQCLTRRPDRAGNYWFAHYVQHTGEAEPKLVRRWSIHPAERRSLDQP